MASKMAHEIILTEKDLEFVSQKAGDNWRSLLTNLGLDLTKIEEFLLKHTGDTRNACFKGLVHWLRGNASEAHEPVSLASLCSALRKSNMNACASDLEKKSASSLQPSHNPPAEDHQEVVTRSVVRATQGQSTPATQGQLTSAVSTEDERSQKIKEIVAMYRNNEEVHLPCNPKLEDDFDKIMVNINKRLSSADQNMINQICANVQLKHRRYIHGVRPAPLPVIPQSSSGLYDFIAERSTPYEVLLVHHTVESHCQDLKADLKEYEERLAKHLESALLSWKKKNVTLPSRKNHTHLAIVLRSRPDLVLLSLVLHIKQYLVYMLQLEEALFEGFAEDCTILFFSILTTDTVLLAPKIITHLSELKRKFEITHLVVFGYFACDLEQGSVEILSQRDDFEMKLKESMENSELLRHELMVVKGKSEQQEQELTEVKIKGEQLQNELTAAKMKLRLKDEQCQEAEKERDMYGNSIIQLTKEKNELKSKCEQLQTELIDAKTDLKLKDEQFQEVEKDRDMFKNSTVQLSKQKDKLERQVVNVKGSLCKDHLETIEEFRKSFEKLASSIPDLSQVEEGILSASDRLLEDLSAKKEKLAKQLSSSKEELSTLKSVCAELEGISSPTEEQKSTFDERERDLESLESTVASLQLEYDNALLKLKWCEEGVLKELKLKEEIQYKSTEKTEEIEAVVSALKIKGKKLEGDEYFRDVMEREKREALLKEEVEKLKADLEDVQRTKEELLEHRVQLEAQRLLTEEFKSKLMEAAIDKGGSVEVEIVKVVTLGPPEAGKTQLKKALTGQFENSTDSTPVSTEANVVMECFVERESKFAWKQFDSSELQSSLCATVEKNMYNTSHSQFHTAERDTSHGKGQVSLPVSGKERLIPGPIPEQKQPSVEREVVHSKEGTASPAMLQADLPTESTFSALKEKVVRQFPQKFGDKHLNKVKLIHMIDSGGQPAFLDFHPVVATSRALYLLVYNSQEGLLACPALTYRKPTEFPTKPLPNPSQTNLDMIKRSLHSLHHCKDKLLKMDDTMRDRLGENVTIDPSNVLPIIVVGSRKAQQCKEDPSHLLKSHCCSIPIWDNTQPNVVLVDSLNPSCSGVEELRETILKTKSKFKIRFPLLWFHCQLIFWSTEDPSLSVLTYHDLQEICMKHKLVSSVEEFLALITTFHMLGLFVCSGIDSIREDSNDIGSLYNSPIFTKPDVLYRQISKILEIPFRDLESPKCNLTSAQRKSFENIQREGIISAVSLHLLGVPNTLGSFTGFHSYLLQSLVKWGLAAQVSQDLGLAAQVSQDPLQLFIPSVLPTRSDAHCILTESPIPQLALAIGGQELDDYYHLPQGLFPHFIVSLIKCKDGGYELRKGRGQAQPHCRDVITLTKDACQGTEFPYAVCAVDNIDHISVHIIPVLEDESSPQWSPEDVAIIIEDMKQSMEEAYSRLYQRSTQSRVILCCPCSFCPLAQQKKHLARVDCERLTLRCLSLERDRPYAKKCSGTMEAILKEMKRAQRKTEPVKLPSSPSQQDSCPPSEEDDVQPSHLTSSKSPEHQHPVLSNPEDFMEHFHEEFLKEGVVDGQMIADKLGDEKVIPKALKNQLAKENDKYKVASDIFNHVIEQGDYESLEALCTIMMNEGGMKKMNKLGKKMLECLLANKDNFSE